MRFCASWTWMTFISQDRRIFSYYLFNYFWNTFLLFSFWDPYNVNLMGLMLSQRSLKISSFLFTYLFFCSVGVSSTMLSTISLIFLVYNLVYYWFLPVFFLSVIIFFISVLLFIFSNSLLKNINNKTEMKNMITERKNTGRNQ